VKEGTVKLGKDAKEGMIKAKDEVKNKYDYYEQMEDD